MNFVEAAIPKNHFLLEQVSLCFIYNNIVIVKLVMLLLVMPLIFMINRALTIYAGKFTLKMRTSFFHSYSGFRMSVICFDREGKTVTNMHYYYCYDYA